ncbi:MAG: hypothetical protein PWR06_2933 [Thermoanaerobacteraceae bacterium]|nr:hypothetical protein [Thermoanaerobacteraceae bacterium]RKL62255.1 sensor histidine kinase [Thermoanaerobacteraceae bacterium SP2]
MKPQDKNVLKSRGGLTAKLIFTYFLILAVSFFILTGSFYFLLRVSLFRETLEQLKKQGEILSRAYTVMEERRGPLGSFGEKEFFKLAGRMVVPKFFVLDQNDRVIASNLDKIIPEGIKMNEKALKNRRTISGKNFIAYNVPLKGASGEEQGTLVLVSDIGDIKAYNRSILRILLYSLVISGIFTLAIGFLMASGITKPLRKLQNHAKKVAGHIFEGSINLKTGDELEDLAESFNYMTERLKEYDEFQKEFFQNVSHDLKTPLMSIKAYAEGIKDGVFEGKEREEGIDVIIKEAGRLKNMVDDILLLSKLESVKDAYNFADIDILDVVREVWEKVEVIGKNQGKKMQLGIPQGRIMIKGDGEKLVNALLNILSNCIRHADSTVMLKVLQEAGRIKILIRDDGEGFKQEDLKRVFRRFFKGEKGDSGLGLAIAKAVIERHGGSISAANSRSGGAEFQIILGLAE